jgi:hypothetical protein
MYLFPLRSHNIVAWDLSDRVILLSITQPFFSQTIKCEPFSIFGTSDLIQPQAHYTSLFPQL